MPVTRSRKRARDEEEGAGTVASTSAAATASKPSKSAKVTKPARSAKPSKPTKGTKKNKGVNTKESKPRVKNEPEEGADNLDTRPAHKFETKSELDVPKAASGPPSLPREGPSLDPDMYPHLFDEILKFHNLEDLMSLRQTCRGLRDRVDAQLAHHLVIRFKDKERKKLHVVPYLFERDYRFSAQDGAWGEFDHWRPYLRYARILDLCGAVTPYLHHDDRTAFTRLHTLRVRGTPSTDTSYDGFTANKLIYVAKSERFFAPKSPAILPKGLTDLIITMPYIPTEAEPLPLWFRRWFVLPDSLRRVTFLSDRKIPKKPQPHWDDHSQWQPLIEPEDLHFFAVEFGVRQQPPPKCTFVNVLPFVDFPTILGNREQTVHSLFERYWEELDWDEDDAVPPFAPLPHPPSVNDYINFVDADAYLTQVGEEEFLLETGFTAAMLDEPGTNRRPLLDGARKARMEALAREKEE